MDTGTENPSHLHKVPRETLSLIICVSALFLAFFGANIETLLTILFRLSVVAVLIVALTVLLAQSAQQLLWKGCEIAKGFVWRKANEAFVHVFVEPIRDSITHGLHIASLALTEIKRKVHNVCSFLWNMVQRGGKKVRLVFSYKGASSEQDVNTKQFSKKAVLLVSLPYGRSYDAMKAEITVDLSKPVFVNWQGNKKSDIPPLSELKTSVRHFALCIVPLEAWDDPTKSLVQKFAHGRFWELIGPDLRPREGECVSWKPDQVERIDAMLEVGVVSHSDDYISEQFYRPLRHAWGKYQVVWWNSFDFAIRLAYLLKYTIPAKEKLTDYRRLIEAWRALEVRLTRDNASSKRIDIGVRVFWASCLATTVVPPIGVLLAVGSWGVTAANIIHSGYEATRGEPIYMTVWRRNSKLLEEKVPQLAGFLDERPASESRDP